MDRDSRVPFHIHIKIGDIEVELGGRRKEGISTLDELDGIVEKVSEAFELDHEKRMQTSKRKKTENSMKKFPTIPRTTKCSEAIVSLLSTDWGKTPRSMSELREAMEANAVFYPKTTISGVLVWLVKKGRLRRWKDKRRGYLYVYDEGVSDADDQA